MDRMRSSTTRAMVAVAVVLSFYVVSRLPALTEETKQQYQRAKWKFTDTQEQSAKSKNVQLRSDIKSKQFVNLFRSLEDSNAENGISTNCLTGATMRTFNPGFKTVLERNIKQDDVLSELDVKRENAFVNIFKNHKWGKGDKTSELQVSGGGSYLVFAQEEMAVLHSIVNEYKILKGVQRVRLLDIPCGDMQWMSRFLATRDDIDYYGMDIVSQLIQHHKDKYKNEPWNFLHHDIVKTGLNESYDIIHCRMMLQHLPVSETIKVLDHFSQSKSGYLVTTTYPTTSSNTNISAGGCQPLNLEIPPIALSPPLCYQRDGHHTHWGNHYVGVWPLPLKYVEKCSHAAKGVLQDKKNQTIHSCI